MRAHHNIDNLLDLCRDVTPLGARRVSNRSQCVNLYLWCPDIWAHIDFWGLLARNRLGRLKGTASNRMQVFLKGIQSYIGRGHI